MGNKRVYLPIIEDSNLKVGYNMHEIMIYRKNEKSLTISFGNHRKESDIYDNIVSVSNIIGPDILDLITRLLMSKMCDNLEELKSNTVIKSKDFEIFRGSFYITGVSTMEEILTELLYKHQRYLMSLSICQSGYVMIPPNSVLQPGDFIKHNNHILRIENIYITMGSDYVIVKYCHLDELVVLEESEVFNSKLLPGSEEYTKLAEVHSIIEGKG